MHTFIYIYIYIYMYIYTHTHIIFQHVCIYLYISISFYLGSVPVPSNIFLKNTHCPAYVYMYTFNLPLPETKSYYPRTSLVVWWIRVCFQGTQVCFQVWEDSTCLGATRPLCHNYWSACPREPRSCNTEPVCPEPLLHTREATAVGSPRPTTREKPQLAATRGSPHALMKT